jgi:hypothetical protein
MARRTDSAIPVTARTIHPIKRLPSQPGARMSDMDELLMIAAYYPWVLWRVTRHPVMRELLRRVGSMG